MSFILDALKKLEEERRRAQYGEPQGQLMEAGSSWRRRQWLGMGGIALLSASVTAAALFLLRSPSESNASSAGSRGNPSAAESSVSRASLREPSEGMERSTPTPVRPMTTPSAEPSGSLPAVSVPGSGSPEVEPPPPDVATTDGSPSEETIVEIEAAEQTNLPEPQASFLPPPPIRLVGKESERTPEELAELDEPSAQTEEATDTDDATEMPTPSSAGEPGERPAPTLVLQGTSVINGQPVAVVNEQRVFVGDWVDGARVIRIEERLVEVEFEGRRIQIRL